MLALICGIFVVVSFVFCVCSVLLSSVADVAYPKDSGMHFLHFLIYAIKLECIAIAKHCVSIKWKWLPSLSTRYTQTHRRAHTDTESGPTQIKPNVQNSNRLYEFMQYHEHHVKFSVQRRMPYKKYSIVCVRECVFALHTAKCSLLPNKNVKSKW